MALPDPYAGEPTVEVDADTYQLWRSAQDAAKQWGAEVERLRLILEAQIGSAHAGTINGQTVVTYRPADRWAEARLRKEHPDLTGHYVKPELVDVFNFSAFRAQHPDVADAYRSRQFRAAD